jgi:hypothetical protein
MKQLSDNILKLEEFSIYVTSIDGRAYYSSMNAQGFPTLDRDGCIEWTEIKEAMPALEVLFVKYLKGFKNNAV